MGKIKSFSRVRKLSFLLSLILFYPSSGVMNEEYVAPIPFISNFLLSTFDKKKDWCSARMFIVAPTNIQSLLPKMGSWEPAAQE